MKNIVQYSFIYFTIVFSTGFVLGTIRVLFLVPYLGEQYSELLELPLMVLVCFFSARFVVGVADNRLLAWQMVTVGLLALLYLLLVEFSLVLWLRNLSIKDYVHSKYSIAGLAYVVSLILYSMFPYIVYRSKYLT